MSTLYIDHRNAELRFEGRAIALYLAGERIRTVPLALLERVVVLGNAAFDARLLTSLAEAGVSVTLVNARDPQRRAMLLGPGHNDAEVRLAQYRVFYDRTARLKLVRLIVRGKLREYRRFLQRALIRRPDLRHALTQALDSLARLEQEAMGAGGVDALRGLEGAGARAAFTVFARLVPGSLGFSRRQRRPPPDPVNALLSLVYTLLYHRAVAVLAAAGLDPAIGLLHEPAFGRASAAADLVELWRARADAWVWRLLAERRLTGEHFRQDKGACLLDKSGRQCFYPLFEAWAPSIDRGMQRQVRALVRALREGSLG